jgi:hypothetical protein
MGTHKYERGSNLPSIHKIYAAVLIFKDFEINLKIGDKFL